MNREDRLKKAKKLETSMRFLFFLPIHLMSGDVVAQYNILEAEWKQLTNYEINH